LISVDFTLESSRISMRVSSSRICSIVASDNNLRMLFSKSYNVLESLAMVRTTSSLFFSTSGFSALTTSPRSYYSKPADVTVKLMRVTLIQISGT
jgi:hypothetical protein